MSEAAQAGKTSSRVKAFFLVVLTFAALGPPIGGLLFGMVTTFTVAWANSGGASVYNVVSGYIVLVGLSILFSYVFAIPHALIAGVIVAVAGIWWRWSNIFVALAAGAVASIAGTLVLLVQQPGAADPMRIFYFMPSSLLAAFVCWYITRGIISATWHSAEPAR
jgi:hypothetical protein